MSFTRYIIYNGHSQWNCIDKFCSAANHSNALKPNLSNQMNWILWPKSYSLPYSNAKRKKKFQDEMNSAIIMLFHSLILQIAEGNQHAKIATYSQYK